MRAESGFGHYARAAPGAPAGLPRTDGNPLNREEYLMRVMGRVAN
ncbi:hypothetical protein OG802_31475 [Streptomyces sp. NBC_00704]|nr:hypothetical protein [Streptomyces sp. NBC_00704]